MIKLYFLLYYEFTKISIFAIGGGYATLPFLYYMQTKYNWFSIDDLTNMIAVANITPGPVGINMATYTGYTTAGIIGSIIATLSILYVPFIITILTTKIFTKFQTSNIIYNIFLGLKPAACALLASIGLKLLYQTITIKNVPYIPSNIDYKAFILFILLIVPFSFFEKKPLLIIIAGALGGILIKQF